MNIKHCVLSLILSAVTADAINIRTPNAADNRFLSGSPGAAINSLFQYSLQDFSGVGWDVASPQKSITMISDTHFVAAGHYPPGSSVRFRDSSGAIHTHTVSSYSAISNADNALAGNSDLIVGTLSIAVSSLINFYPVLDPALSPVGQDILVYGQFGRVGESKIVATQDQSVSGVEGKTTLSQYINLAGDPDDAYLTDGDSGGPSFIIDLSGNLILSGVHWAVGEDVAHTSHFNVDTNTSEYINQLNKVSGLTVTTSSNIVPNPAPEPSTSLMLGLAAACQILRRKR